MKHAPAYRCETGFTLVEVLLVVFIMSLITGVAVLTLPEREDPYEKTLAEVQQTISAIRDRSILTGEVLGVSIHDDRVSIVSWTGTEWQPTGRAGFDLPPNAELEIVRERGARRSSDGPSVIVFNPLGVTEPVRLDLRAGPLTFALKLTEDGDLVEANES
ncbi:prepilin-type N-terminal cleavage/methylation domain-containing protein [Henriciella sp. AS95]|uniref:prepilin-type N-terminal cleavage/methylation domain-containing protein n=1 Tax=Henriciella sp. AS95 TaxID=3135782 RepID=UPI00316FCBD4